PLPRGGVLPGLAPALPPGATPAGIAVGPDGNIWFTELDGNRIGRLNLAQATPGVTATLSATGVLTVTGDAQDSTIVVSRDAAGTILVNNGAIAIEGGPATVANTRFILLSRGGGHDH